MLWFNKNKTIEKEIEMKVSSILNSIIGDVNSFTHREQSIVVKKVFERFQEIKKAEIETIEIEIQSKKEVIDEINESLKILIDEKQYS